MTAEGALAGLRVIDLSRVLAGPLCTQTLGDLGAEVIKVERPGEGDDTRNWGPPYAGPLSAYFIGVNRNKRSLTLDLSRREGRMVLDRLIRSGDVLVDNFKRGTLARWDFDDAWFEANAPGVIRCSITGYGPTGPKSEMPGYDFILQAETGLMAITGEPGGAPMKLGVAIVDICTGMQASIAILAALEGATPDRSGPALRGESARHRSPHTRQCRLQPPRLRRRGGALWQRSSQHRPLPDICGLGRRPRPGRGQRPSVRSPRRRDRSPRMVGGPSLRHQPGASSKPRHRR